MVEDNESPKHEQLRVDLSWLGTLNPEIESQLLPAERAPIAAMRRYAKEPLRALPPPIQVGKDEHVGEPIEAVERRRVLREHLDATFDLADVRWSRPG